MAQPAQKLQNFLKIHISLIDIIISLMNNKINVETQSIKNGLAIFNEKSDSKRKILYGKISIALIKSIVWLRRFFRKFPNFLASLVGLI